MEVRAGAGANVCGEETSLLESLGTDAKADPNVKVLDTVPEDTHPRIIYPAAVLAKATSPEALAFLEYLKSETAAKLFTDQGFTVLAEVPAQ